MIILLYFTINIQFLEGGINRRGAMHYKLCLCECVCESVTQIQQFNLHEPVEGDPAVAGDEGGLDEHGAEGVGENLIDYIRSVHMYIIFQETPSLSDRLYHIILYFTM
jgi:hypothetical protein